MYDGSERVPLTMIWSKGLTVTHAPFYYDGITYDEFLVEECYRNYYHAILASKKIGYKSLKKQLEDGEIQSVPDEYKITCPFPEKCTAFSNLVRVA